ncbi:hypothetical protein [Streptomyces sp. H27-H5]|uniref:hypothetical protein n=1 Tax=Streptomyces sp. H27-H5 TaxID=2996460 RepID=UPI00226E0E54|nr:hypothetical protein [Streptomyces sp. H27-H5]MCY0963410.1 hypothetical protein [Streptomyces sp. H27-H5]
MTMNPDQVPPTPIFTITVSAHGAASVDGEEITAPGLTSAEARVAALAEIRIKAAYHGRPVRVLAKEADGTAWPLIVGVDGAVTTVSGPHPTAPAEHSRAPKAPDVTAPAPSPQDSDREQPSTPPTPGPVGAWIPGPHRPLWETLVAQETSGALVEAIITADRLESELSQQYGPQHRYTLHALSIRAWLTLRHTTEWAETTELLIEAGERLLAAGTPALADSIKVVRNAHGAWRTLRDEDSETAREFAPTLLALFDTLGTLTGRPAEGNARAHDVLDWAQNSGARSGAA